ncbi:hypothetical protein Plhal304r1_c001g0001091 [Plasmopara halstedii]
MFRHCITTTLHGSEREERYGCSPSLTVAKIHELSTLRRFLDLDVPTLIIPR